MDGWQILRPVPGEQHAKLALGQTGNFLGIVSYRSSRHRGQAGDLGRGAPDSVQPVQQAPGHRLGVRPLHHDLNGSLGEDAVVLCPEGPGRDGIDLVEIAVQFNARRVVAVKTAAGLAHTVKPLVVVFALQTAPQGFFFNADRLRVETAVHQIGVEQNTEHDVRIVCHQVLPREGKLLLDAADVRRKDPVASCTAQVDTQVGAVQGGQPPGKLCHIRAACIASLQYHGKHRGIGGTFPPGRVAEMDGNAASVEFFRVQLGQKDAGRQLFSLQRTTSCNGEFYLAAERAESRRNPHRRAAIQLCFII